MARGQKAIESLKSEKGRQKKQEGLDALMTNVETAKLSILNVFILTNKLEQAKKMFINKNMKYQYSYYHINQMVMNTCYFIFILYVLVKI